MAWTHPDTPLTGDKLTAPDWWVRVRDNLLMLADPWDNYGVVWGSSGTAPAIGNGTLTGVAKIIEHWCRFRILMVYGTTSTAGTGTWTWSLPATPIVGRGALGTAVCFGGGILYPRFAYQISTSTLVVSDHTPTRIGGTVPFSWSSTSELNVLGEFEVA